MSGLHTKCDLIHSTSHKLYTQHKRVGLTKKRQLTLMTGKMRPHVTHESLECYILRSAW